MKESNKRPTQDYDVFEWPEHPEMHVTTFGRQDGELTFPGLLDRAQHRASQVVIETLLVRVGKQKVPISTRLFALTRDGSLPLLWMAAMPIDEPLVLSSERAMAPQRRALFETQERMRLSPAELLDYCASREVGLLQLARGWTCHGDTEVHNDREFKHGRQAPVLKRYSLARPVWCVAPGRPPGTLPQWWVVHVDEVYLMGARHARRINLRSTDGGPLVPMQDVTRRPCRGTVPPPAQELLNLSEPDFVTRALSHRALRQQAPQLAV